MKQDKPAAPVEQPPSQVDSIIDLEVRDDEDLEINSQHSSVRELMNNTSARHVPSYTPSYTGNSQFS